MVPRRRPQGQFQFPDSDRVVSGRETVKAEFTALL